MDKEKIIDLICDVLLESGISADKADTLAITIYNKILVVLK